MLAELDKLSRPRFKDLLVVVQIRSDEIPFLDVWIRSIKHWQWLSRRRETEVAPVQHEASAGDQCDSTGYASGAGGGGGRGCDCAGMPDRLPEVRAGWESPVGRSKCVQQPHPGEECEPDCSRCEANKEGYGSGEGVGPEKLQCPAQSNCCDDGLERVMDDEAW